MSVAFGDVGVPIPRTAPICFGEDGYPQPSIRHTSLEDESTSFEGVATLIAIYKLSRYWANIAMTRPDSFTPEDRQQKAMSLVEAESMIQDLSGEFDKLSKATRQQLFLFFNELHQDELSSRLQSTSDALHSRWAENEGTDNDPDVRWFTHFDEGGPEGLSSATATVEDATIPPGNAMVSIPTILLALAMVLVVISSIIQRSRLHQEVCRFLCASCQTPLLSTQA